MALCCINRHPTSVRMEMNYNYAALFDITKLDIPFWVEFDAFFHVIYGVGWCYGKLENPLFWEQWNQF